MPKHTLPEDRRTELANWLTANGIDPRDVLVDADLSIIDTDNGRAIHYEATVCDTTGRLVIDARGDRLATEMRTVPLQTEPPKWWTPYVKPTREQLLAVVDKVRALHQPTGVVAAAEHGNPPDCTTCGPNIWPCPTIRALDGEDGK